MQLRQAVASQDRGALLKLSQESDFTQPRASTQCLLGTSLGELGEIASANLVLRLAQERHPGDFWLNLELARHRRMEEPANLLEVVRFYSVAVGLRPKSGSSHTRLAFALAEVGRNPAAIAAAREAIRLDPNSAFARRKLGQVLLKLEQPDEAIVAFDEAIRLRPDFVEAYISLGNALAEVGQFDAAVAAQQQAARLNPQISAPHYNLGLLLKQRGDLQDGSRRSRCNPARTHRIECPQ